MFVKQISVFLENKAGRLAQVTGILSKNGINIRAMSIADTTDFGILRLIVDNPKLAVEVLRAAELAVKATDVIAISVADKPGSLYGSLKVLEENGIGIEYMYASLGNDNGNALVILKVDDCDAAIAKLRGQGVSVLDAERVYQI